MNMRKALSKTVKYIALVVLFIVSVTAAQFGQHLRSNDDVREHALEIWAGEDEGRQEQVIVFTQFCLKGRGQQADKGDFKTFKAEMELKQKGILPEPAIAVCAEKYGYTELYGVVKKADMILQSAAWPLSMMTNI